MSAAQVGDRVRVEYEGVVTAVEHGFGRVKVRPSQSNVGIWNAPEFAVAVVEPEREIGSYWLDDHGRVYMWAPRLLCSCPDSVPWVIPGHPEARVADCVPARPLTHLAPQS